MNNHIMKKRIGFPKHLDKIRKVMPDLVSILETGRENSRYCFAWFEENKSIQSGCAKIESSSESLDRGIVLRALLDGVHFERSTNQLDESSLIKMAKDFRFFLDQKYDDHYQYQVQNYIPLTWSEELSRGLDEELVTQIPKSPEEKIPVHFGASYEIDPSKTDIHSLKEMTRKLRSDLFERSKKFVKEHNQENKSEVAFEDLVEIQDFVKQEINTHIFVDRYKNMSQSLLLTCGGAFGITKLGRQSRSFKGGLGGLEIIKFSDKDLDEVSCTSVKLDKAELLKPGRYQVITGPDVTGVIAHEAFGHTQEGDTWMKARSIAKKLHEDKTKVGNNLATIINNPAVFSMDHKTYGPNGSYFFDHEGMFARSQKILDQGMLSLPMADLASSIKLSVPRMANGKRESWRRPLMARQTNTYFTPGDKTLDELIAMVKYGFLAKLSDGGMEDPKGGSLTAGVSYFEEISNGKLTGKLFLGPSGGHIELSDPVFTLLEKIVAKSKTLNPDNIPDIKFGGCGKYHKEGVNAGCGGPYILWKDVNCG